MSKSKGFSLSPATEMSKTVNVDGEFVVLNMMNHPTGIRIPTSMYQVWDFDGFSPISMYRGKMQYNCNLSFKGDPKTNADGSPNGRKAYTQGGEDWFAMFHISSTINSEVLFRTLCEAQGITDAQISAWEDNALASATEDVEVTVDDDELVL